MSGLFIKKVHRNYRSKARDSDEDIPNEHESLYEQGAKGAFVPAVATDPSGIKKSKSVLSFEDDLDPDDGNEFKVKKSNLSRRLAKQAKEHKKKKSKDDDVIRVVNRKEPMERKSTPKEEESVDSEEKLERLRKQLLDLADDEETDVAVTSEGAKVNPLLKRGAIPDAATIHMARKQREKAKIMLDSTDTNEAATSSGRGSGRRLVSEDDDDDEEDLDGSDTSRTLSSSATFERRPAFVMSDERDTVVIRPGIGARLKHRENELDSIRKDFLAAEHGSDRDSDQEAEWERQQIQKALITQNPAVLEAIQPIGRTDLHSSANNASNPFPAFAGLSACSVTLENLKSSLQSKFKAISTSLEQHETALRDAKQDLERGRQLIADCREKLPGLAKKFSFAQDMKAYVDDLVECFNEKMSKIEYMERRSTILLRERYHKLVERRRQDMKDMADLATQTTPSNQVPKTPEDVKLAEAKRRRCAERESRRIRRQRARENAVSVAGLKGPSPPYQEGLSTDDDEPQSVIAKRKADMESLLVDAGALFEDVVEEYCHLPSILQRFADWHTDFPESYAEAYVSLCLPQLFSPLVRLQLIGWNPLATDSSSLERMGWFMDLLDFACLPADAVVKSEPGLPEAAMNGSRPDSVAAVDDEQLRLLPYTVEKVVLKRLNELVAASWDPLSRRESQQLTALVRDLTENYPTLCVGSRPTEQLFETIVKRIEVTIQEDIFIPLYPRHLMQNRQGPAFQFFDRQFRVGMKLLKNIFLWHNLISTEALQHVSLTCLVNRYLLVGLASLLSAITAPGSVPVEDNKPPVQPPPFSMGPPSTTQNIAVLTFQDACERLTEIVDTIPQDWMSPSVQLKTEQGDADQTSKTAQKNPASSPDALAQLRRFLAQLLDRRPSGSKQAHGSSSVEREWTANLNRLKTVLG